MITLLMVRFLVQLQYWTKEVHYGFIFKRQQHIAAGSAQKDGRGRQIYTVGRQVGCGIQAGKDQGREADTGGRARRASRKGTAGQRRSNLSLLPERDASRKRDKDFDADGLHKRIQFRRYHELAVRDNRLIAETMKILKSGKKQLA